VGNLEQPGARVGGKPHDEEQRVPAPVLLVVELDRADLRRAHCSNQPCMTWANIMSPVSFSFPVMKACIPFSVPVTSRRKSGAWRVSVTRAGPRAWRPAPAVASVCRLPSSSHLLWLFGRGAAAPRRRSATTVSRAGTATQPGRAARAGSRTGDSGSHRTPGSEVFQDLARH